MTKDIVDVEGFRHVSKDKRSIGVVVNEGKGGDGNGGTAYCNLNVFILHVKGNRKSGPSLSP